MSIKNNGGVIEYNEAPNKLRTDKTHVFPDDHFAVADKDDPLKQIQFDPSAQSTDTKHTITAPANSADVVTTLPGATGTLSLGAAASGAGAKNGATVSATETGNDVIHKTVLTLASTVCPVVSTTTSNGVGGIKIYDFPEGHIRVLGCVAEFTSILVPSADEADYTDNTPEGDIGVGTVTMANTDSFGTDATDDDLATGAAFTMTAFDASANCNPEAALNFDGTSTAKDVNVNVLVDAADIDDGTTSTVELTGTVTVTWMNLGDF